MSEEIKPVKSERIDNSDGSYIVKEVLEENPYGFLSVIQYFDSNNLLIKEQNFSDDNFENLAITSNRIYKNKKCIESRELYEQDQGGWYSIIGKYDSKGRLVQVQQFFDKEFKELYITEKRKYDIFNNWVSKVVQENDSVWAKRYYKKGKLVKEKRYDKETNKICDYKKYKYYKNGQYKVINKYDKSFYDINTYDADRNCIESEMHPEKRVIKWQYINGEKCKEKEYENNKLKSSTDLIYDENNKLIEEKIVYYELNKEKYYSVIKKYNIDDNSTYIECYADNKFQNLLKTEEEYKIDGGTMTFGKYTDASAKIKSYKIENKKNIKILYYTDNSFNTLYATWHKKFSDNEMEEITIIEEPTTKIMPFDDNNYEISTQFSAIIGNLKNNELYVTFFSDKDFKDPVCYLKNSKTSKNGNKCLFYNKYPKENFVEVRKYKDKDLIYVKQYKKFKFLAKIRYYLGI